MRAVLRFLTGDGEGGSTEIDDEHGDWWPKVAPFAALVPANTTWYCTPVVDNEQANLAQRELLGTPILSHPGATTSPREDQEPEPDGAQMTDQDLNNRLKEPFPPQVLGTLRKGGTRLTYVPIAEVIVRLNDVLGVGNWSSQVIDAYRDQTNPDWIIAHVRLTATIDGQTVQKEAFGGQAIKVTRDGAIVDLGDEFKGAVSDALKKAATQLGVGLELARKEEALRWEEAQHGDGGQQAAPAQATPAQKTQTDSVALATEEERAYITNGINELIEKAKIQFREWWKENNLPKPAEVTAEQFPAVKEALDMFLDAQRKYLAKQEAEKAAAASGGMNEGQAVAAVKEAFSGAEQVQYAPGEEPFD